MTQSFGTEDLSSSAQDLASLLVLVESRRDVEGQDRLPKSTEFRESGIQSLTAKEFRLITRMPKGDDQCRMEQRGFRGCVGFIAGITKGDTTGNVSGQNSERSDESTLLTVKWPSIMLPENHLFFSQDEFLIGDSAYPADVVSKTLVPAYKSNMKGADIEDINNCVAHARVVNELY
ncbi:hypothetical protein L914_19765 [Phytophthora nicotianae]|uniref:DDE Tnp4 domain-containing protein n=1 Tax=Phytophthora nicotianae TaxID=4792 RepID=W2M971_PHYNI|nr:hypothetical protein L914_19765 [Phytophthora nicotianae]